MTEIFAILMFTGLGVALVVVIMVVCAILIGHAIAARRRSRIAARVAQKRCPRCGYDVADLGICPECGFVIRDPPPP